MAQKKYPILNTPKGVAVWPSLNSPDTKFKEEGEYTCRLAFDPNLPEVQKLVARLEEVRDEQFEEFKAEKPAHKKFSAAPVFTDELDKEGEETGRITINFKMRASGISKQTKKPWARKPQIFDSKGKEVKNPPNISGGSILRVACELGGFGVQSSKLFYVTIKLVGVKLIELVTYGGQSADSLGFGDDEGGYEASGDSSSSFDDNDNDDDAGDSSASEEENGGSGDF